MLAPGARLNASGTNHLDSDDPGDGAGRGDQMGDDCEPTSPVDCSAMAGFDDDYDGIQNECDNCPAVVNVDQADCDDNGVGDACDADADGDRVSDGCDSCVDVPNTTQSNCNLDAELVLGLEPVGDACDPNPCPDGATGVTPVPMGTLGGATTAAFSGVGRQTNRAGTYARPTAVRTAFRGCACSLATNDSVTSRDLCRGPLSARCEIAHRRIDDAFVASDWGWRTPSVTFPTTSAYGNCFATAPGPSAPECTALYNTFAPRPVPRTIGDIVNFRGARPLNFLAYWDFAADATTAGASFTHPDGMTYTQGVQWYRARRYETDAAVVATLPADTCNRRGDCPAETEFTFDSDLTSHYSSGRVDAVPTRPALRPLGTLGVFFLASRLSCATCAGAFPRVALSTVLCTGADCPLPRLFARLDARTDAEVTARFSPGVLALLRDPTVRLVQAAEPADRRSDRGLLLAAVDATTLAPRFALSDASGTVGVFQGQGDPVPPPGPQTASVTAGQPNDCVGAFPLLDANRGTLFVLGGRCDGLARTSFRVTQFFAGGTRDIGLTGVLLDEVLAATLDPVNGDAIVLDRVTRPGRDEVRLLRVDLAAGRSTLIATRRASRAFERYHLAAVSDGTVVLAASRRGRASGYRLIHLRVPLAPGPVDVLQTHVVHGTSLEGPPTTDSMGVSVIEGGALWRPVGVRWMDFRERPGRGRDFDDCF